MEFRNLHANEIECRVSQVKKSSVNLLLYKDARCDMRMLDKVVKPQNWQREHKDVGGVVYCGVSIKCTTSDNTSEWVTKWDAGAESYSDKEKGQASDSFKRACFNWGIGRELYTAPVINIKPKSDDEIYCTNEDETDWRKKKYKLKYGVSFSVYDVEFIDNIMTYLEIVDQDGYTRLKWGTIKPITKQQHKDILELNLTDDKLDKWLKWFKVDDIESLSYRNAKFMLEKLEVIK